MGRFCPSGGAVGPGTGEDTSVPSTGREGQGPGIVLEQPAGEVAPGPGREPGGPHRPPGAGGGGEHPAEEAGEAQVVSEVVVDVGGVAPAGADRVAGRTGGESGRPRPGP